MEIHNPITDYAGLGYRSLNMALRSPAPIPDDVWEKIVALDAELEKMPSYNNSVVYRNDGNSWDTWKIWHQEHIGCVIRRPEFLSTFKQGTHNGITLEIRTNANSFGRSIEEFLAENGDVGKAQLENEVLFKRGCCFRIVEVDMERDRIIYQETDEEPRLTLTSDIVIQHPQIQEFIERRNSGKTQIESASELGLL